MRILKTPGQGTTLTKFTPVKEKKNTDVVVITDKVELQDNKSLGQKLLTLPKKVIDYTKPRYYETKDGAIHEMGDSSDASDTGAAMSGAVEGYIFGGGPVGLLSGALGGYVGTKIGKATRSDVKALAGGAAVGAATGVATTVALSTLLSGSAPGAGALVPVVILGGLAGTSGTLGGNKFVSVRDGMYGGVVTGLVGQALTGNSGLALAGAVGAGVGGQAPTTAGKIILGGGAGAVAGAVTAIPAVLSMGTAGLPVLGISAAAGAISGAGGAIIGPVIRRTMRNVTMDINEKVGNKIDKAYENRTPSKTTKVLAGAGMGAIMLGPLGLVFGGAQGAAIGATAGAVLMGGKTLYKVLKKEQTQEKGAGEKSQPSPTES